MYKSAARFNQRSTRSEYTLLVQKHKETDLARRRKQRGKISKERKEFLQREAIKVMKKTLIHLGVDISIVNPVVPLLASVVHENSRTTRRAVIDILNRASVPYQNGTWNKGAAQRLIDKFRTIRRTNGRTAENRPAAPSRNLRK